MNKLFVFGIIWGVIILAYIVLAVAMPAITDITATSAAAMGDTSGLPGVKEGVQAFPVYVWFIPGGVGIIATVILLKRA